MKIKLDWYSILAIAIMIVSTIIIIVQLVDMLS